MYTYLHDVPNNYSYVHVYSDTLMNTYKTKHQTGNEFQMHSPHMQDNRLP